MGYMKALLLVLLVAVAPALYAQDLSGTYTGIIKADTPDDPQENNGTIVLKQDGEKLIVTVGPNSERQLPASKVERNGDSLKFELAPPGDSTMRWRFEVTVKGGKMTGKVITTRGDETLLVSTLDFTKR